MGPIILELLHNNIIMKVFICLSALFAIGQCGPLNAYLTSGAAAGPLHPAVGALSATKRGWRNIALEGFSEDDNQDGFVDPIAPAVVAAPVVPYHLPYVHHAVAPVVAAPAKVAAATPVLTYAAPHVYTGYTVAHHPVTYAHVPAATQLLSHAPVYGGLVPGYPFLAPAAVAAPVEEEAAITDV